MIAKIEKCVLSGVVEAPTSKSMAHRLLICAALSEGKSKIKKITFSEDIYATLDCLKLMGVNYTISGDTVTVYGINNIELYEEKTFNCRESGSTLRFILPLLLLSDVKHHLTGKGRLMERPQDVYEEICDEQGLTFEKSDRISVKGKLKAGNYYVKGNISSQFITGLLFALSKLSDDSRIFIEPPLESGSYIDMTISAMEAFGVKAEWIDDYVIYIKGGQRYTAKELTVEGDYSGSAFLDAFNFVGGNVEVTGLNPESLQGDKIYKKYFTLLDYGTPILDVSDCPDLAPVLMTLGAIKHGVKLIGTKRLKIKESDRGLVMAQELSKFGADIEVMENSIIVHKSPMFTPKVKLKGHNDHRVVMSLSVICSVFGGEIDDAESVNKSFPGFFDIIISLGGEVKIYDNK